MIIDSDKATSYKTAGCKIVYGGFSLWHNVYNTYSGLPAMKVRYFLKIERRDEHVPSYNRSGQVNERSGICT